MLSYGAGTSTTSCSLELLFVPDNFSPSVLQNFFCRVMEFIFNNDLLIWSSLTQHLFPLFPESRLRITSKILIIWMMKIVESALKKKKERKKGMFLQLKASVCYITVCLVNFNLLCLQLQDAPLCLSLIMDLLAVRKETTHSTQPVDINATQDS